MTHDVLRPVLLACALGLFPSPGGAQTPGAPATRTASPTYWVYVGAESADLLHRVRFTPGEGAVVEKTVVAGEMPDDTEGPHGLRIDGDGRYLYMTTGHGLPTGKFWKIELGPDSVVGEPIFLGRFPATLDLTPDGLYAFVVNFNLHGAHEPSTVSTVFTRGPGGPIEVAQTETCTMPHGSRTSPDGRFVYSACMMDDRVVELDTRTYQVARQFSVAKGAEGPFDAAAASEHADHTIAPTASASGAAPGTPAVTAAPGTPALAAAPTCSPTWVQPAADGRHLYVACNASDEVLEISTAEWTLTRRWATGRGPYNMDVTGDGGLLFVTLKQGAGVEVIDLEAGRSQGRAASSGTVTHGVALSPDGRYAFVSVENVGMTPGKVDVFDLETLERVASVEVGQQAGGIAFWRMEGG